MKIVLFAYSRGMLSVRAIVRACQENVIFMALSADTRFHFTTIEGFISSMDVVTVSLFRDILTICYTDGRIGRQMFAIDGCKISSNCAKGWMPRLQDQAVEAADEDRGGRQTYRPPGRLGGRADSSYGTRVITRLSCSTRVVGGLPRLLLGLTMAVGGFVYERTDRL